MKFGLKWVHMARYELILRLDGALWLRIILKPLLTPKRAMEWPKIRENKVKNILELVNSEGFLAEVFHPWVRWEGPGSGFENSSGAGGVWKSRIWPPWDLGRKTRFSNGLAYNRSKVSVKKSQIGFVVINFSRSRLPYMPNNFMDG